MYGWKGRIGLIIPTRNTTMEPEFYQMSPKGVSVHATRMLLEKTTVSDLIKMETEIYSAATYIKLINPKIIVVGCTSGSFIKGKGYDQVLIDNIKHQTGIQAITTSTAMIAALKALNIKKVSIATPYTDEINAIEKAYLEDNGVAVLKMKGLGYSESIREFSFLPGKVSGISRLEPYVAYNLAVHVNCDAADAIVISCTNFRTIEIIQALEQDLKKPVITSNQATMWHALRCMGINKKIQGLGKLLELEW